MARPEKKRGEWGAFFSIILMVGILATWALIPVKAIESSWRTEQETMVAWAGEGTQHWIESQAGEMLSQVAKEGAKAVNGMGSSQIGWLAIWSGVCNSLVGKLGLSPCLCAHDVGTDWNSP